MHLFTLLITAAFSTQFTAFNAEATTFTLEPNTVLFKDLTKDFEVKIKETGTATWETSDAVHYIVSNISTISAAGQIVTPSFTDNETPAADGEIDVTFPTAKMTLLAPTVAGFKYYVYAGKTDVDAAITAGYQTVTVLPDFTPNRKAIRKVKAVAKDDCPITLKEEGSPTWGATPKVVVTKEDDGTGGKLYSLTDQTSGEANIVIEEADWDAIALAGTETEIYIHVGIDETAARGSPGYKVPIIEDEFALTPTELAVTATTIKDIIISPVATISPDGNKIQIFLSKTEEFDLGSKTFKEAEQVSTTNTYKLASFTVSELGEALLVGDVIYVYVKYTVTSGEAVTTYLRHSQEILIKPLFVVEPAEIFSDVLTIPTVTITTSSVDWTNPIEVKFATTATSPPEVTGEIFKEAHPVPTGKVYEVTAVTLPTDPTWKTTPKIYVHVGVKVDDAYVYTGITPVEITVTPVEFSLSTDALKESDTAITNIEVTPTDPISVQEPNEVTLYFSTNPDELPTAIPETRQAKATYDTDKYTLASWTIDSSLILTENTPVIVHVSYKIASGGAVTFLRPARTIAVGAGEYNLEFGVSPKTLASDVTSLKGLKISPINPEKWAANKIKFKITDVAPESDAQSNDEKTGTATKDQALNEWVSDADVDITSLTRTVGTNLYVYASMANSDAFLPIPDTIAIEAPTPPPAAFTVDPAKVEVKDLAAFKSIKITESATQKVWTAIWVVISKTTGQQTPGANDVVKENQAVTAGVCTIALEEEDFTTLGTLDETVTLYVHAAPLSTDAALAAIPATIAIEKTLTFTIAPKEMEWKETLTTPEITITPTYPGMLPQTEVDTFVAKFTKTVPGGVDKVVSKKIAISGEDTKIFKIPATDLAELAIAKPTTAETLKVSLHSAQGALGEAQEFKVNKPGGGGGEAAMGVSPLLSLLAAALLLLVKLF